MNNLLVLDGNWLLHRAFHVCVQRATNLPSLYRSIPNTILSWVGSYGVKTKSASIVVCIDGSDIFRYKLYPQYKSSRKGKKVEGEAGVGISEFFSRLGLEVETFSVYDFLPELTSRFDERKIAWQQDNEVEADDLLSAYAHQYSDKFDHVYLCTKDKDTYQSVTGKVIMFTPSGKKDVEDRYVSAADMPALIGMTPKQFHDYQTLIGDPIDDIPQLLKPAKAKALVLGHATLKAGLTSKDYLEWTLENQAAINLNRKLVTMVKTTPVLPLSHLKAHYSDIPVNKSFGTAYDNYISFCRSAMRRKLF